MGRGHRDRYTPGRPAFTIIEVLIVVVILGIVATLLVAVVERHTGQARATAARDAARSTSQAIDLFKSQTATLPDLITSWTTLTAPTTLPDGRTVGPFLSGPPVNSLYHADHSCITDAPLETAPPTSCAFLYDYAGGTGTGRFAATVDSDRGARQGD